MIIPILQLLASLYILFIVLGTLETFNIKLNIHTISLIILGGMVLLLTIAISYKNLNHYLNFGLASGILFLIISGANKKSLPDYTLLQKVSIFVANIFFWPQIILLLLFLFKNFKNNESI